MSVYTAITADSLGRFLSRYGLPQATSLEGIEAGMENTNYRVSVQQNGQPHTYILTLFETINAQQLPFFLQLMQHLHDHGLPVPLPLSDRQDRLFSELHDKPAALITLLPGSVIERPSVQQCKELGASLARLHLSTQDFQSHRSNPRNDTWWKTTAKALAPNLATEQQTLLNDEIRFQSLYQLKDLPQGIIHADLFRDNVLFQGEQISAILDLYAACNGPWLYDLAIAISDWCINPHGLPDKTRAQALLTSYHQHRPLTQIERGAWPVLLRRAALRFWLSRLEATTRSPRRDNEQQMILNKDPNEFMCRLQQYRENEPLLRSLWPK
ncbi:MAG: homoserine kinase [Gammaproteobacteria bacterium]|nr:homoserine kinase [Gammaproteobacteria bacterium]